MKNSETLEQVLKYIDANLDKPLSVEGLALQAGYSPYHFSRVFSWGLGISMMEYVRIRKMNMAAYYLSQPMKIIDIAMALGFETHSGFSKAFKKHFNCTPDAYRTYKSQTDFPEHPSLTSLTTYHIGGHLMKPRIMTQEAISIVGYKLTTTTIDGQNSQEIPAMWRNYHQSGDAERLHNEAFVKNHSEYGVCLPENPETKTFDYMIAVAAEPASTTYETALIPAAIYAVFTVPASVPENFVQNIQETWNYIFNEWFPTSGYEFDKNGLDYEYYPIDSIDDDSLLCDIYLPIRKQS